MMKFRIENLKSQNQNQEKILRQVQLWVSVHNAHRVKTRAQRRTFLDFRHSDDLLDFSSQKWTYFDSETSEMQSSESMTCLLPRKKKNGIIKNCKACLSKTTSCLP